MDLYFKYKFFVEMIGLGIGISIFLTYIGYVLIETIKDGGKHGRRKEKS